MNQISVNPRIRRAVAMVLYAADIPVSVAFGTWLGYLMMPSLLAIPVAAFAAVQVDLVVDLVASFVLPPRQVRSR